MSSIALAFRREQDEIRSRIALRVLGWWALSRAIVFGSAGAIAVAGGPRGLLAPAQIASPWRLLSTWDGHWYRMVALRGYLLVPGRQSDPAFFPGYPILLRGLRVLGLPLVPSSVVLSNLIFLAALVAFASLSAELLGAEAGLRAARWLAIFPLGVVFSMAYPESLLFLLVVLCGLWLLRGRFGLAGLTAGLAALVRPEGALLALPALFAAWHAWPQLTARRRGLAIGSVAAGPASLLAFPLYLGWALGNFHAWSQAQRQWGRQFRLDGIVHAFGSLPTELHLHPWFVFDLVALGIYLSLLLVALRFRLPTGWILLGALLLVLPLGSGTVDSLRRFGLIALPVYWALALLGHRRWLDRGLVALALAGLAAAPFALPFVYP